MVIKRKLASSAFPSRFLPRPHTSAFLPDGHVVLLRRASSERGGVAESGRGTQSLMSKMLGTLLRGAEMYRQPAQRLHLSGEPDGDGL